jgi:hypothetical protein
VPVPGELAQLPDLRRRDPRLRQPAHPQQVGQVRGVALIFSELGNDLGSGRVRVCLAGSGAVRVAGWVCAGAAGGFGEGGDAELDGLAAAGDDLVHLGEFGAGAGEADLQSFGFSEPAAGLGFGDAGDEVVTDLDQAVPGSRVWPQERAAQVPLTELTDARIGYRYGSTDCDRRAFSALSESWSSLRVAA